MLTLIAASLLTSGQLYASQISVSFARTTSIAPPLPVNNHSKFSISVFNGTKDPVTILKQTCQPGYESLSFELTDPKGKSYTIKRKPKKWNSKEPVLEPMESIGMLVLKIDLGDGTWSAPPAELKGVAEGWKARAKFAIAKSKELEEKHVWSGTIMSGWTPITGVSER
jgi:hypothetical protein